jgi:hypothetical protein
VAFTAAVTALLALPILRYLFRNEIGQRSADNVPASVQL